MKTKTHNPKSVGQRESSPKREIHSNTAQLQLKKKNLK